FTMHPLPKRAQISPVNGIVTADINGDGNLDVLVIGNDYGNEVFSGRFDAGEGLVLLGDGEGAFSELPSRKSGFAVRGDAKALARLKGIDGELVIATQNLDSLRIFANVEPVPFTTVFQPLPGDAWVEVTHSDGRKERIEFYYGSGYLSQSTRSVVVPENVSEIRVHDFSGSERK